MVRLKFIVRESVLVLRISEGRTRYYKRVGHLLKGNPNIEKHWVKDKERFSAYAISYSENNKILDDFKQIFWKVIQDHPELTAQQVAGYYQNENQCRATDWGASEWRVDEYQNSVAKYLDVIIQRERAKSGCNYEIYHKLNLRCRRDIPNWDALAFSMLDYNRMVGIAYIFARSKGYRHMTKAFRALLGRAHKDHDVRFNLSQIGEFCFNDYNPDRYSVGKKRPDVLSEEQLRTFMNLNVADITPQYKNRYMVGVYYDFCVFMFHSFFAPCDVLKAKWKDITKRNTLEVRRKKTHRIVEVPITPVMRAIIDKYKGRSKFGYIFPVLDDEEEERHNTKDYTYKKFRQNVNIWLKLIGKMLGTEFDLYAYVFRHTAITVACNHGLPTAYVANAAGTSIEIIQQHYYNGENAQNRDALTSIFMAAGV